VLSIPTDGSEARTLYEEEAWLGHVNPSSTRPELLTYCEEGPWDRVDNRIWVLDAGSGERWPLRETSGEGGVGHEYWMRDGERVGLARRARAAGSRCHQTLGVWLLPGTRSVPVDSR